MAPLLSNYRSRYEQHRVLLLNADFNPLGCPPKRLTADEVVTLMYLDKVTVLSFSDLVARSARVEWPVPQVVALKVFQQRSALHALANYNAEHLFIRDEGRCQYTGKPVRWGAKDPQWAATVDHVVPLSQGGTTTWDNCVLATSQINSFKTNRKPEEAGLKLLKKPWQPRVVELLASWVRLNLSTLPQGWQEYLEPAMLRWHVA